MNAKLTLALILGFLATCKATNRSSVKDTLLDDASYQRSVRAIYNTAQWPMTDYVLSGLLQNLSKDQPRFRHYLRYSKRMSHQFGQFQCVDNIADLLMITEAELLNLCRHFAESLPGE